MKLPDLKVLLETSTDWQEYHDTLRVHAPALIACAVALGRIVDDRNAEIGAALENDAKAALRALEAA